MFRIRAESGEPIYEQLVRQVKHAIMTGALKTGEQLPPVRELAAQLVINPNTVARAYRELERAGLLESTTGRGTFVKFAPPKLFREERRRRLQPFLDQLVAEATALNFSTEDLKDQLEETIKKFKQTPV